METGYSAGFEVRMRAIGGGLGLVRRPELTEMRSPEVAVAIGTEREWNLSRRIDDDPAPCVANGDVSWHAFRARRGSRQGLGWSSLSDP